MDNPNAVEININIPALVARLNAEVSNLNFMVQKADDPKKRDAYYAAMILIEAAAQNVFRTYQES